MSSLDDFEFLREIIFDLPLNTQDLLKKTESLEMPFEFSDLVKYWQAGLLYVSQVQRFEAGYLPSQNCIWTSQYQDGFFCFESKLGAYQINENMPNTINETLEGTIPLGSSTVCLAIHPNRQHFAVGSRHGIILVCDINQCSAVKTLQKSESRVWTLAYSPSGRYLISGHRNGDLLKWTDEGDLVSQAPTDDWVRSISFNPENENEFITSHRVKSSENPSIYQWKTDVFQNYASYLHIPKTVWSIRYLADGKGFVAGGSDYKVTLWSFSQNRALWSEEKHKSTVTILSMHPKGGVVASGVWAGAVKIWNLESGENLFTIEAHSDRVYGLAFSPSGNILATGSKDSEICIWQMPAGNILARFKGHSGWVRALEFINEDTLISIGTEGFCKIWRLKFRFPETAPKADYHSSEEVLNDYRGIMANDNE